MAGVKVRADRHPRFLFEVTNSRSEAMPTRVWCRTDKGQQAPLLVRYGRYAASDGRLLGSDPRHNP
jgi:hypothetical protein